MWRLKESAHGNNKRANALLIKQRLEALNGKIPGLLKLEVGIDVSGTESSSAEFVAHEALDAYQAHPAHKAIVPFVREARAERRMVDYEI